MWLKAAMATPDISRRTTRFGDFEADCLSGQLRHHGIRVRLPDQSFRMLLLLLDRAGEVVTREELRRELWEEDTFVDFEAGMNSAVKRLRDALGDCADTPRFVETLPRRGYRFIAPVDGNGTSSKPQEPLPVSVMQIEPAPEQKPPSPVKPRLFWRGTSLILAIIGHIASSIALVSFSESPSAAAFARRR